MCKLQVINEVQTGTSWLFAAYLSSSGSIWWLHLTYTVQLLINSSQLGEKYIRLTNINTDRVPPSPSVVGRKATYREMKWSWEKVHVNVPEVNTLQIHNKSRQKQTPWFLLWGNTGYKDIDQSWNLPAVCPVWVLNRVLHHHLLLLLLCPLTASCLRPDTIAQPERRSLTPPCQTFKAYDCCSSVLRMMTYMNLWETNNDLNNQSIYHGVILW